MQCLLPSQSPDTHAGGRKRLVRSVRIFDSQSDHLCICPVRVLLNPQTKTQGVPLCRILSADLQFKNAPKDLMAKFVDCLVQLPNLRALEVFSTSRIRPITAGLKQKRARLPSVRQLGVSVATAEFVGSCPDVESVVVLDGLSWYNIEILSSFSGELGRLKRFIGVESGIVPQGELRAFRKHQLIDGASRKLYRAAQTSRRSAFIVKLYCSTDLS